MIGGGDFAIARAHVAGTWWIMNVNGSWLKKEGIAYKDARWMDGWMDGWILSIVLGQVRTTTRWFMGSHKTGN